MHYFVLDIGGSSIKYALMDEQAQFLDQGKVPTPVTSLEDLYQTIEDLMKGYDDVAGVGISMPGIIDPEKGYAYTSGALGYYNDTYFARDLSARLGVPVTIGNDAKCAANAEIGFGVLKDVDDAAVIILGTGIGGCLVKDHKVHTGKHFSAGEVSGMITSYEHADDANYSWCMRNGIIGLLSRVQEHLHTDTKYTGEEIFAMAHEGNQDVLAAINEFSREVAIQLMNINTLFDCEKIAIGGGISAQMLLMEDINKNYQDLYAYHHSVGMPVRMTEIVPCAYRNDANLLGALYQHLSKQ